MRIYDETEKTGKYKIFVQRSGSDSDHDCISLQQVTLFIDDLIPYLRQNLKIELKSDGTIDYLSLAHSYTLFNQKNLLRVKEAAMARRQDTSTLRTKSSDRQSQERSFVMVNALEEFTIGRNNRNYQVLV